SDTAPPAIYTLSLHDALPILAALRSAERDPAGCTDDEYLALATADGPALDAVAALADSLRRDTVGDDVTYVVNRNINFTNICYRSEEHTSELQSRENLVCRLL